MPKPEIATPVTNLAQFCVSPERGFLPTPDPLRRLPVYYDPWEEIAHDLPKHLAAGTLREVLVKMSVLDTKHLGTDIRNYQRAMLLLSYFGHGEVYGGKVAQDFISKGTAIPWRRVACCLGRPPVLSYASYALSNWRRIDAAGPIALGNIALLQNFLGGLDEEWFILVHVDIEAKAGAALSAIWEAQQAMAKDDPEKLSDALYQIVSTLRGINKIFARMPEGCDPYIYYHRVRPYIHGWKNNPALPNGVLYEGVSRKRMFYHGETGAQSSVIPALNRFYGIRFTKDELTEYEDELVQYMPPPHRVFLQVIERGPSLRSFALKYTGYGPRIRELYNEGVYEIAKFLKQHLDYAGSYIHKQSQTSPANPSAVGTGGTPFMRYLKKHHDETLRHLL